VTGSAFLIGNGTVVVTPLKLGHYNSTSYVILSAGTRNGTFAGLTVNGSFAGSITLDYSVANEVLLDVNGTEVLAAPPGANQNQLDVLNGINNGIIANPTLPAQFANLGNLSGPALLNALSLLSGEEATGAQTGAFNLLTQFLDVVFDQGLEDGGGGGMAPFAPERTDNLPPDIALAYARVLRKAPPKPVTFEQPWHVWGAGFGGTSKIDGDPVVGSHDVTARDGGGGAGADYRPAPDTVLGFALAGGGFNWGLAQGLGGGRADSFEAAIYGRRYFGPAYVAGAEAFANHWMTTNRIAAFGDQLTASFNAESFGARLEAGDRFAVPVSGWGPIGVTPYAALQAQSFHTPSYSETDLTGGGFALSFNSMNGSDTRSELGARLDDRTMLSGLPLVLRGRLAWAHDWVSNPALNAAFQALPGAAFTVNGAKPPADSALTSAGAELWLSPNWSVTGKFDGEFANGAQTYAGTGTVRYRW
jgi:uncharacterized protein YhjY with autotransporter beta-barrel domain